MAKTILTYEFDTHTEQEELNHAIRAQEAYRILWELDQDLRNVLKYGEHDWLETEASDYLEHIREQIWNTGIFRDE